MRRASIAALAVLGVGVLASVAAYSVLRPATRTPAEIRPAWAEVKWPFPIDQWGTGKAFRCKARDCGTQVDVYFRPKIGFCNCTTGVADDAELERVADLDLLGDKWAASASGHPIAVRWMKGRSRLYGFSGVPTKSALALAFNDRCDVVVATIVAGDDRPGATESAALAFLNSDPVIHWAEAALGL